MNKQYMKKGAKTEKGLLEIVDSKMVKENENGFLDCHVTIHEMPEGLTYTPRETIIYCPFKTHPSFKIGHL